MMDEIVELIKKVYILDYQKDILLSMESKKIWKNHRDNYTVIYN